MMMASNTLTSTSSSSSSSSSALTTSAHSSSSSSSPTTLSLSSSVQSIAASATSKLTESDSVIQLNNNSQTSKSSQQQGSDQTQYKAVKLTQSKTASTIDISESTNDSIKDLGEEHSSKASSSESQLSVSASSSSSTTVTTMSDTNSASKTTVPTSVSNSSTTVQTATTSAPSPSPSNSLTSSDSRWIFPAEKIINSPSRLDGMSMEDELTERQQAALFITDLGALLKVNQLCMNTAIIYMHRFFMIHSFKKFQRYVRMVATACLFFACKVEEQPRRLREFIEAIHKLFHSKTASNEPFTHNSEEYRKYGEEIVAFESCLLQTLGFNVLVNHAHTVIIKTCQMIKAPRDLAEAAYLTATNSLILTNFCVKFSCEKVACFCIYLACKWTQLIIPTSSEGMQWYQYVKHDIVEQELEDISKEYLSIFDKCSPKIQRKLGMTKSSDDQTQQQHKQAQQIKKEPKPGHHPQQHQPQQQQQQQHPHPHHPSSQSIQKHPHKVHNPHHNGHPSAHHPPNPLKTYPQQPHPHSSSHHHQQQQQQQHQQGHPMHKQAHHAQTAHTQQHFKQHNKPPNLSTHHSSQPKTNGHPVNSNQQTGVNQNDTSFDMTKSSTNGQSLKAKVQQSQHHQHHYQQQQQQQQQAQIKTSPSNTSITAGSTSIKRINEDLNNVSSAPKIRKYVIDQNSTT